MASNSLGVVALQGMRPTAGRIEASAYPNDLHLANANGAMLLISGSFPTSLSWPSAMAVGIDACFPDLSPVEGSPPGASFISAPERGQLGK